MKPRNRINKTSIRRYPWTSFEIDYMEKNYRHYTTLDIAKKLDRGVQSVYQKARQLELTKSAKTKTLTGILREIAKRARKHDY